MNIFPESKANKSSRIWVLVALLFIGWNTWHNENVPKVTEKDLVQEANGKKALSSEATDTEKKAVVLLRDLIVFGKQSDEHDAAFNQTFTGKHMFENVTLSSPDVAAQSLKDIQAEEAIMRNDFSKMEKTYLAIGRVAGFSEEGTRREYKAFFDQWQASFNFLLASEDLYSFAADPANDVHIGPQGLTMKGAYRYNAQLQIVRNAAARLDITTKALDNFKKSKQQMYGVTNEDLGAKPEENWFDKNAPGKVQQ